MDRVTQEGTQSQPGRRPQIGVGGFTVSERAKELVAQVLDSNRLTPGPVTAQFEAQVAALHGCRHGLMCNSGTSALHMALAVLKELRGWEEGDEVLVPAVTFVATSNVVLYNGLKPVFVEVEPDFFTIDPERIEERITARTRAIIPVHIGGLPCDMEPILDVARRHDLGIIEDSAETMFARYKGQPVGSFGDVGCFSTYAAHVITTGVGGLCTTNDDRLIVILKSLMNHGRDSIYVRIDDDRGLAGEELFEIVDRRFSFVRLGHSFRATEMEAAVGLAQLENRELHWERRQDIVAKLDAGLRRYEDRLQLPKPRPDTEHAHMFYPVVIRDPRISRGELVRHLEERGIETRYLLPLINQPVYRELFGNLDAEYPVAARLNEAAFYVGCHVEMSDEDADYVVDAFAEFLGSKP